MLFVRKITEPASLPITETQVGVVIEPSSCRGYWLAEPEPRGVEEKTPIRWVGDSIESVGWTRRMREP